MKTLNELFNKPLKYKTVINTSTKKFYSFVVGKTEYVMKLEKRKSGISSDTPYWSVIFAIGDDIDDEKAHEISGTGNEIKVFSTVLDILTKFDKKRKPNKYFFSAEEPSRRKLYNRLIKKFGTGFNIEKVNNGKFLLTRK